MTRTLIHRHAAVMGTVLLAGILLSACTTTDGAPGLGSTATSAAATIGNADVVFAQHMIPHHQQAVAMAALAGTRASDPEIKTLATQIETAQDPEITMMTGWLRAWGKPLPDASTGDMDMDMGDGAGMGNGSVPGMMSAADMTKLAAVSGKEFDKQFLLMMIEHHQGAITMAQDEVNAGNSPDAVALANKIVTAQQAEIVTMKKILARL